MIRPGLSISRSAGTFGFIPGGLAAVAALAVLLSAVPLALTAGTHEVQRARKATAEVVRDGGDWVVSVDFIAAHGLGAAKDVLDNQRLARDYALRGLQQELKGDPGHEIVVTGFQTERSEEVKGRWKARFRIPANGVSMRPRPEPLPDPKPVEVPEVKMPPLPDPEPVKVPEVKMPPLPDPEPVGVPEVKMLPPPAPEPVEVPEVKMPPLPIPESVPSPSAQPDSLPFL